MDKEYRYLIELTRAYLNKKSITLSSDINYTELIKLAAKHNLMGVIYCALNNAHNKEIIGNELFSRLQQDFFSLIYLVNLQEQTAELAGQALSDAKIRFVCFKGIDIKRYYPVPESRMMGDIDILIDEENMAPAKSALNKAGFKTESENGSVWNFRKDSILIELHSSLMNKTIDDEAVINYFSNAMERAAFNGYKGTFDSTFHFEYLVAHIAHHFRFYGAGIKLVLDLAIMLKYTDTELDKAITELDKAGLGKFARVILSVCFKWYGVGKCFYDNTEETELFLTSFGAFGTSGRNKSAVVARRALENNDSASTAAMKLRLIFPEYKKLKELPYIKFLNGRPYLVPLAWGYRIIYTLKHKGNPAIAATKGLSDKNTLLQAENELAYFEEIGLL